MPTEYNTIYHDGLNKFIRLTVTASGRCEDKVENKMECFKTALEQTELYLFSRYPEDDNTIERVMQSLKEDGYEELIDTYQFGNVRQYPRRSRARRSRARRSRVRRGGSRRALKRRY